MRFGSGYMKRKPHSFFLYFCIATTNDDNNNSLPSVICGVTFGLTPALRSFNHTPVATAYSIFV